ncbi:MAG TPA: efflux RND transporter periplasmic adaptor subunit [Polyangiaceae bacterium]|jgi:RND family efflux transporter MFP subunit
MNDRKKSRSSSFKLSFGLVVAVVVAGIGAFFLGHGRRQAVAEEAHSRSEEAALGPYVEVAPARTAPAVRGLTLSGEVHAFRESTLFAKVSGYLKMVRVDKGDKVREGEVLGVIEAPEVEQQIASKRADVALKKLTDARYAGLVQNGVISQQDKERSQADLDIATADLATLGALRGYQIIRAPFEGVITARYADPGALLQAATSSQSALPLVRIADIARVRVFVYLGQKEALLVHEGDPADVWTDADPDKRVQAKVARFSKELDPRTRTMLTEIELDNRDAHLYPGAFVRVTLTLADRPTILVPADSLFYDDGKSNVAVVRDGRAHYVTVDVADTDGKTVRLRQGAVQADELVVLHPGDEVPNDIRVRIAEKKAPPAASGAPVKASR